MKRRTKVVSLAAGFAALTAVASVPAFGQTFNTGSNFVLISNQANDGHDMTISEYPLTAGRPADKSGTWRVGQNKAHYWVIDTNDWVEVEGLNGFDAKIAATDLPACFRITHSSQIQRVSSCNTDGASQVSW